ncbi:hypothetical protein KZC57_02375 [Microbacterium sp. KSW4-4]|nr:hypothetical protein [Microbacterium sp. KSW4-4]
MNAQLKNVEPLGLTAVMLSSLPATLMTDDAPDRYTVEAVFTRQADRDEVAAIHGVPMRDFLSARGYPTVELKVSDRRLEIANTNLPELRDGLAAVIAERLVEINRRLVAERLVSALGLEKASAREHERVALVASLAESVVFAAGAHTAYSDDASRASDWEEEGGAPLK